MTPVTAPIGYRFGHFELQPGERRLLASGQMVHLGSHAFDLLTVLLERSGHLVTKDELLRRVWDKVIVEENTLHSHISALRKVLGPEAIATVSGRGYRFAAEVVRVEATPETATPEPKHNLPHSLTSFVGREKEIVQARKLLNATRLLTLIGAGGCGKTRLALEVAAAVKDVYPDGVWMVELASRSDPGLVMPSVAQVLGQREEPGKPLLDTLTEYLTAKHMLLVLDNAEHLLEGCAVLVDGLLRHCARLVILVTSREHLGVAGEQTYRVPSLTVPAVNETPTPDTALGYEAVRLFLDRVRLVRPTFAVTAENAAAVASICSRLDGIPLAIELAAPRLRSMSAEELSQRLDQRFALLTDGSRAALPRHRTLRSMVDWSYDLLSKAEQAMLRRVSVFAGGWTLAAAEQVCTGDGIEASTVIELLASLVDKSPVLAEERDGVTRYRMLETVRQYAHDRLLESGGEVQWRDRHLAHFLALGEESASEMIGGNQQPWIDRLAIEQDNFRAALAWSASAAGNAEDGLRLANALARFWVIRWNGADTHGWFTRLLAIVPRTSAGRTRANALNNLGIFEFSQGEPAAAEALYREALGLYRELDYTKGIASALNNLGCVAIEQARYAEAEALFDECLTINRAIDYTQEAGRALMNLGVVARARGDLARAREFLEEALSLLRDSGNQDYIAEVLYSLGHVECEQGNYSLAEARLRESVTMFQGLDNRNGIAQGLECLARVGVATGASTRGARLWGTAERVREEIGHPMLINHRPSYNRAVDSARTALGDEAFTLAWREGRAIKLEDAVKYALSGEDTPPRH